MDEAIEIPTHRFTLSTEQFARERLTLLKEGVKELQRQHPEILSFCLYGSMVKGEKVNEESDIDGFWFVDIDKAQELHPDQKVTTSPRMVGPRGRKIIFTGYDLDPDTNARYKEMIESSFEGKGLIEELDDTTDMLRVLPISRGLIDMHIAELVDRVSPESSGGEIRPLRGATYGIARNMYAMFHLDIGGGIRPYRAYYLDQIAALDPRVGEYIWNETVQAVEMAEYTESVDPTQAEVTQLSFPRSLEAARTLYGGRK